MRFLAHSANGVEVMGEGANFLVEYSFGCEGVDAHLPGGVDDTVFAHVDAYMDNASLFVAEKTEVVALAFV